MCKFGSGLNVRLIFTCLVCFSSTRSFSMAAVTFDCGEKLALDTIYNDESYFCKILSFREHFVNLLREVFVRLEELLPRHCKRRWEYSGGRS
jgi:hypothetical protein